MYITDDLFKCGICEQSFSSKGAVFDHAQKNHDGYKFQCQHCQQRFRIKSNLESHQSICEGEDSPGEDTYIDGSGSEDAQLKDLMKEILKPQKTVWDNVPMPVLRLGEEEANSQAIEENNDDQLSEDNFSDIDDSDDVYAPTKDEKREAREESDEDEEEFTSPKGTFYRYNSHPEFLLYSYQFFSQKLTPQETQSSKTTCSCIRFR